MSPAARALLMTLLAATARADAGDIHGSVADSTTRLPIAGVEVRIASVTDSTNVRHVYTLDDGVFRFSAVPTGSWKLVALAMGYARLQRTIRFAGGELDLGNMIMPPLPLALPEVVVKATPPPAVQHGDTTEFSSGAVATHPDATAEDLVAKLPGITVDHAGTVKSNGEDVEQVLVNGRPYYGSDATLALRSLPAELIDRIQVFDKLSDQSEFTGVDDGQTTKTMNVILRSDEPVTFGRAFAGGGRDGRYQGGGHLNAILGDTHIAAIGQSNNLSQQNFSSQDLLGVLGNGSSGRSDKDRKKDANSFLVGPQDGITTTNAIGGHVDARPGGLVDVSQSYFFNSGDNHNAQDIARQYAVPHDSVTSYSQRETSARRGLDQRLDGRYTWAADSTAIDVPRLYFQSHRRSTSSAAENDVAPGQLLSRATNLSHSDAAGHDLSNHLLLRHRFGVPGRTISLDIGAHHELKDVRGDLSSTIEDDSPVAANDTLNQRQDLHTTSSSVTGRLVFTEPVGSSGTLLAMLAPGFIDSRSVHHGWEPDAAGLFTAPIGPLTNTFRSISTSQAAGLGYATRHKDLRIALNLAVQRSSLRAQRLVPGAADLAWRSRWDALPSVVLKQKLPHHRNLTLSWTTAIRPPTITQLQDVVDDSDPLVLSVGNPQLTEPYTQSIVCRYSATDPARSRSAFLGLSYQHTNDAIGVGTWATGRDTVLRGVTVEHGAELVSPINAGSASSLNLFGVYSRPVKAIGSLVHFNSGVTWTQTPGTLDDVPERADVIGLSQGVVVASSISPALDFTLSYTGTYNIVRSTLGTRGNTNYFTHTASLRLNAIALGGFVVRQELDHTMNAVPNGDEVLWNSSIGQKLLHDHLDLRITASDLLARNRSVTRTVTDAYIQDEHNLATPSAYLLTATYTWGQ